MNTAQINSDISIKTYALDFTGDVKHFLDTEWLLTNSHGGFAMGSALALNTRRYHGLLIAPQQPPVGRRMLLNTLSETVILNPGGKDQRSFNLDNHQFADGVIHPQSFLHLKRFEKDISARWYYQFADVNIIREVYLFDDMDLTAITYHIASPAKTVHLRLHPLISLRDFHHLLSHENTERFSIICPPDMMRALAEDSELIIRSTKSDFTQTGDWWYNFLYAKETERGLEDKENLFNPGYFSITIPAGSEDTITLYAGTGSDLIRDIEESKYRRRNHLTNLCNHIASKGIHSERICRLGQATNDYIVERRVDCELSTSILAGFPWFADWGRDTMICLPGLLLETGRYNEALLTLKTFGKHVRNGLVPNRFDDYGGSPHYNTVDASLWYIHAACRYLELTDDRHKFHEYVLPACKEIIKYYRTGTDFGIGMDEEDKLIYAGNEDTQLTWMDAKRDNVVFTPRHGKAVEINALWHHALLGLSSVLNDDDPAYSEELSSLAKEVAVSFRNKFWNDDAGCLYDCLIPDADYEDGWRPSPEIRPNQLFAVSLSNSPLRIAQQRAIVDICQEHLLTPMGLRTLSPQDPAYRPRFEGDMFSRDAAYHQGTVWPWLIGPFIEAFLRVGGFTEKTRKQAYEFITPLLNELDSQCLGQIAEVYDGGDPNSPVLEQRPQGCVAQAWSVAELLRAVILIHSGPVD